MRPSTHAAIVFYRSYASSGAIGLRNELRLIESTIMPTRNSPPSAIGSRVYIRPPRPSDEAGFLRAARASRSLHGQWARAPSTRAEFAAFTKRFSGSAPTHIGFLMMRTADDALCGVFNFSEIVRNAFNS